MSVVFTTINKVVSDIKKKKRDIEKAIELSAIRGMEYFQSKIISEQMTGRPGLNVQTGNLRRSWFVKKRKYQEGLIVSLATRTKYARIHQYGGVIIPKKKDYLQFYITQQNKWIKTKKVTMPKRLNILEDFKKSGISIIAKEIHDTIKKTKGK